MRKTKKMVLLSLFTTIALTIFVLESQIPSFTAIPGIKLGLANCITLLLLILCGWREAAIVLFMRILLGCIFTGQAVSFVYSITGGVCCLIAMKLVMPFLQKDLCWVISVIGAVFHNLGQIVVAYWIIKNSAVFIYVPILMISAIVTGTFTGFCIQTIVKNQHIKNLFREI